MQAAGEKTSCKMPIQHIPMVTLGNVTVHGQRPTGYADTTKRLLMLLIGDITT